MNNDHLAGVGLGALVGCLLGFSSQSIVAGSIAAVLTVAAGFIGVAKPAALAPTSQENQQNSRVAAFGLSATLFFALSYYAAVQHILEPSPKSIFLELKAANFSDADAHILIGNKYFGAVPVEWKKATPP